MAFQPGQPAPAPSPPVPGVNAPGRAVTNADLGAISRIRGELIAELAAVRSRREGVLEEIRTVQTSNLGPGVQIRRMRALDQLVAEHDQRILQIESDLTAIGRRVSAGLLTAGTAPPPPPPPPPLPPIQPGFPVEALTTIGIVAAVVFLGPISLAISRLIWKRGAVARPAATWDSGSRLDRLEHSVDAIGVEVERISEGQRYVTRLLTESPNFAVDAARAPVPEPVSRVSPGTSGTNER